MMRSVHLLGLSLIVGAAFLGAVAAIATLRWQTEAFLERSSAPQPAGVRAVAAPIAIAAAATPPAASGGDAARGKTLFDTKCAGCHSIGGGRLAGPDLKGIADQRPHDWLIRFIVQPDQVIASGDATARQLVSEYGLPMPNLGISTADAEAILRYLSGGSGASPAPQALPPGDAERGALLFSGEQPLTAGGPACMGCHNLSTVGGLGGGSWGLDLTRAGSTLGSSGIAAILQSPQFPGMAEAYASHPITPQEIADLTAYIDSAGAAGTQTVPTYAFPLAGIGALTLFLGVMQLGQRGRAQGVRRRLLRRSGR